MEVHNVMAYNLTFATPGTISTFTDYATYLNGLVVGGSFWTISIFVVWMFFFIGLIQTFDEIRTLGWSSFITALLSLTLVAMNLINNTIVVIFAMLTGASIILGFLKDKGG